MVSLLLHERLVLSAEDEPKSFKLEYLSAFKAQCFYFISVNPLIFLYSTRCDLAGVLTVVGFRSFTSNGDVPEGLLGECLFLLTLAVMQYMELPPDHASADVVGL